MSSASTSTSRSTVRAGGRSRMTIEQKVATFATQHTALTQELDSLDRISTELPNLESGLELLRTSVSSAETRIAQGREQLRKEWRAHSESAGGQMPPLASISRLKGTNDPARARLQHEYRSASVFSQLHMRVDQLSQCISGRHGALEHRGERST